MFQKTVKILIPSCRINYMHHETFQHNLVEFTFNSEHSKLNEPLHYTST